MKVRAALFFLLLVILLIVFAPLWTIWSLNLLFGLSIPTKLSTWAAAFWLMVAFGGSAGVRKNRE